jgi:hypothetical protein
MRAGVLGPGEALSTSGPRGPDPDVRDLIYWYAMYQNERFTPHGC